MLFVNIYLNQFGFLTPCLAAAVESCVKERDEAILGCVSHADLFKTM